MRGPIVRSRSRARVTTGPARSARARRRAAVLAVGVAVLIVPAVASAHARVSPAVSVAKQLQLYSLAVPTEKDAATTTKIVLTVPSGFAIDSFVPSPGWKRVLQQTGSGEDAVIQKVTWTGGKVPTEEDSLFQFLAQPASSKTYEFSVQQTYSDGSIVNWTGPGLRLARTHDRGQELARRRRNAHPDLRRLDPRGARTDRRRRRARDGGRRTLA